MQIADELPAAMSCDAVNLLPSTGSSPAAQAEDRKHPFRRRGLVEVLVSPNGSWTMLLTYPSHPTGMINEHRNNGY